jgi:cysteinyl-tRNA synthetase
MPDGKALIKFMDKEQILKQREEKKAALARAAAEKEEKRRAALAKEAEMLAKGATPPEQLFKDEEGVKLYSKWDEKVLYIFVQKS